MERPFRKMERWGGGFGEDPAQISKIASDLREGWRILEEAWRELRAANGINYADLPGGEGAQVERFIMQQRNRVNPRAEKVGLAVLEIADIRNSLRGDPVKVIPKLGAIKELASEISRAFEEPISTNFEVATKLRQLSQDVNKCFADCCRSLERQACALQDRIDRGYANQHEREELREIQRVQNSKFYEGGSSGSSDGCNIL